MGQNLAKIPLHHIHEKLGAKMCPFAGYLMPVNYGTSIMNEHKHVRQNAGLFDVSHMGAVIVEGERAAEELEKVLPTDIQEMSTGQIKYSLIMNSKGGVEDDLLISKIGSGFLLVLNAGNKLEDLKYLQSETDCNYIDLFNYCIFALQGPRAKDAMKDIIPSAVDLKFMEISTFNFKGHEIYISRTGYTGEDGFEIIADNAIAEEIFTQLLGFDFVQVVGLGARDSLRLEAGLCLHGHDINDQTTPIEAKLNWVIGKRRREEGGFLGADIVLQQREQGAAKKLVGFIPNSKAVAREGATIHLKNSEKVGEVTSGLFSPMLEKPVAMGYVETEKLEEELFVNIRNNMYSIELIKLPFVPHKYYKV